MLNCNGKVIMTPQCWKFYSQSSLSNYLNEDEKWNSKDVIYIRKAFCVKKRWSKQCTNRQVVLWRPHKISQKLKKDSPDVGLSHPSNTLPTTVLQNLFQKISNLGMRKSSLDIYFKICLSISLKKTKLVS